MGEGLGEREYECGISLQQQFVIQSTSLLTALLMVITRRKIAPHVALMNDLQDMMNGFAFVPD